MDVDAGIVAPLDELLPAQLPQELASGAALADAAGCAQIPAAAALARVLLRTPEILLLDEPTAGLSREQAKSVLSNALRYAGDATVILVTHDVEETAGFDAVWNLEGGRLSRIDPGAEPLLELRS